MKRLLITLTAVLLLVGLGYSPLVSAHVLKENDGVSAVLHIDPDDNPVAGTPTKLELDFGQQIGSFSLNNCICGASLVQNGKTIQQVKVLPAYFGSTTQGVATITFPKIGIYNVIIAGHSKDGTIPRFSLNYLERVASTQGNAAGEDNGQQVLLISSASLVLLGVVAHTYIKRGERYKVVVKTKARGK